MVPPRGEEVKDAPRFFFFFFLLTIARSLDFDSFSWRGKMQVLFRFAFCGDIVKEMTPQLSLQACARRKDRGLGRVFFFRTGDELCSFLGSEKDRRFPSLPSPMFVLFSRLLSLLSPVLMIFTNLGIVLVPLCWCYSPFLSL